jgi:hypothetical protein
MNISLTGVAVACVNVVLRVLVACVATVTGVAADVEDEAPPVSGGVFGAAADDVDGIDSGGSKASSIDGVVPRSTADARRDFLQKRYRPKTSCRKCNKQYNRIRISFQSRSRTV